MAQPSTAFRCPEPSASCMLKPRATQASPLTYLHGPFARFEAATIACLWAGDDWRCGPAQVLSHTWPITCMKVHATAQVGATSYPSAAESRVLQRPSGASILAAASMPIVAGSRVHSAAVNIPCAHVPRCSMPATIDVPDRDDEHAVSMLTAGPADHATPFSKTVSPHHEGKSVHYIENRLSALSGLFG